MKTNKIQFYNCLPKLVHCSQEEQYGVVTQDGLPKIFRYEGKGFWLGNQNDQVEFRKCRFINHGCASDFNGQ